VPSAEVLSREHNVLREDAISLKEALARARDLVCIHDEHSLSDGLAELVSLDRVLVAARAEPLNVHLEPLRLHGGLELGSRGAKVVVERCCPVRVDGRGWFLRKKTACDGGRADDAHHEGETESATFHEVVPS